MKEDGYDLVLPSPLGRLGVHMEEEQLRAIEYLGKDVLLKPGRTMAARRVAALLEAYFHDGRTPLELPPLRLEGTEFQRRVWRALCDIPAGSTLTYGDLAARLGSGARAIGGACRENPVPILVPCHRVVGKTDGGGYSGHKQGPMMARKYWLLAHEGALESLPAAL
jgi:methylated-DNA-[protein]-cysteine S-methyltransferase